jgi:hypothetical protein
MISTRALCRLVRAAMAVDVPAGMAELKSNGCWVHVDEYEKFCDQVTELHAALKQMKREGAKPDKKRRKR